MPAFEHMPASFRFMLREVPWVPSLSLLIRRQKLILRLLSLSPLLSAGPIGSSPSLRRPPRGFGTGQRRHPKTCVNAFIDQSDTRIRNHFSSVRVAGGRKTFRVEDRLMLEDFLVLRAQVRRTLRSRGSFYK